MLYAHAQLRPCVKNDRLRVSVSLVGKGSMGPRRHTREPSPGARNLGSRLNKPTYLYATFSLTVFTLTRYLSHQIL